MNDWIPNKLWRVIDTNIDTLSKDYPYDEILYLDTGSITEGKITELKRIRIIDAPSRAKRLVKHNDVIYSTVRPLQRHYGLIEYPENNLVVSTGFCVISAKKEELDPRFLYYFLSTEEIVNTLDTIAEGSTSAYPSLKPSDIESLDIQTPPLPEQRAIADVLSSLDKKIELLQRENETLEAMAETIFQQWFVEVAGDDSEIGKLSDFTDIVDCLHSRKPKRVDGKKNTRFLLQVFNISDNGLLDLREKYFVSDEDYQEWTRRIELRNGDLIISKTGRVGAIAQIPNYIQTGIGRNLVAIRAKVPYTIEFLKDLMFSKWMQRKLKLSTSDGTILQSIHVKSIENLPALNPGIEKIQAYSVLVSPIHKKTNENWKSIELLGKLRDILLPKLMSGELRVHYDAIN